jgi:hypothetical protein
MRRRAGRGCGRQSRAAHAPAHDAGGASSAPGAAAPAASALGPRKLLQPARHVGAGHRLARTEHRGRDSAPSWVVVTPRRRRHRTPSPPQPLQAVRQPNDVWATDFKGWFRTRWNPDCPLDALGLASRYLLRCESLHQATYAQVQPVFVAAFRERPAGGDAQ